jgi:hypothetical protein
VLVQKKLIDSELIYDMKRIAIIDVWEKFSPIVARAMSVILNSDFI